MTKRTAISKLEKAGLLGEKCNRKGYTIAEGHATSDQIRELFGEPVGRYTDYRSQEYTMWRDEQSRFPLSTANWRLSLFDNGEFVLV